MRSFTITIAGASLLAAGCSTRPRTFEPVLAMPSADSAAYQQALADCRTQVASGKRSGFGPAAAATGAGVAAGYGAGAATFATGAVPVVGASAVGAVALVALMPLAGIAAGFGVTRAIRSGREKKINRAMSECLAANGYSVASWRPVKKAAKRSPAAPAQYVPEGNSGDVGSSANENPY